MKSRGRKKIVLTIRETNIEGQLFFKANGFRAVGVLRNWFDEVNEDAYLMEYSCKKEFPDFSPVNRISMLIE